ncbi:MAG: hypothetical protein QGI32_12255 [Candidatus Latescibacteria bacterium]|jgi:hypothetical protein|nr:hypothetical protein [Candidatus Latescibacterota bacterium]
MPQREELEQALDALEAQRETLGDAAVEAAQAGLRLKLAQVLAAERPSPQASTPDVDDSPARAPGGGHGPQTYAGDHRTNTGMYEGDIAHAEVNAAISASEKVVLFGQQTRLRSRRLMTDERLSRIQPGHRLSKFFYGGVRQLPERLLDALLAKKVSVTLVRGRDLLVFHDRRRHQSFHTGRTRRTIYLPEPILEHAYQMGYDYWAIAEILIQESWPLLDYILLLEMIERCQVAYEDRWTLGYSFLREGLRAHNKHMRDLSDDYQDLEVGLRKGDEMGVFLDTYMGRLCELDRSIVGRDPHDVAGEIYKDEWERFSGRAKLDEVATLNSFPTYFMIDRDIVHPAAFHRADQLGQPVDPRTAEDAIHDLWDETRFKSSLSVRTEELLELLIALGAPGIRAFLMAVSFRYSAAGSLGSDGPMLDLNRYGMVDIFRGRIQSYSGSGLSEVPGSIGYDLRQLQQYYVAARRAAYFEDLRQLPREALQEQAHGIRETLSLIVDETVSLDRAQELKGQIVTSRDLTGLLDAVEMAVKPESDESERQHMSGLLYKLDEHPLYHERFLPGATQLNDGQLPGPPSIRPEVQRLHGFMPERYFELSSDPADLGWFLAQFRDTDENDAYNRLLFTWAAAILVRYDNSEDYGDMCSQIVILGEYAVPPLEEITASEVYYASEGRGRILKAAQVLLPRLPDCPRTLRTEWSGEIARRRGLELEPGG